MIEYIHEIDLQHVDVTPFSSQYVGCLILTADNQILLQKRSQQCHTFPGKISTFGGKIESNETPSQALKRELLEELGADVSEEDLIFMGAVTELVTQHTDLIYEYFWHDNKNTITGCYEESPIDFKNAQDALTTTDSNLMDDVVWLLKTCQTKNYIP